MSGGFRQNGGLAGSFRSGGGGFRNSYTASFGGTSAPLATTPYVPDAFTLQYDQITSDTNAALALQGPISDGIVGVARNQHQISANIDKMIADFEKRFVLEEPEEELKLLEQVESGITDIDTNLKNIDNNESKVTKTIQENHEVIGRGQGYIDQADTKVKQLNILVKNRQEEVEKTEAAISATRAEIQRKENDVRNAEREIARNRRKKIWIGILTLGVGAIIVHQQLQASKGALNHQRELLAQQQGFLREKQEKLTTTMDELRSQSIYKYELEWKMRQLNTQGVRLSRNRDDLNKYRGFLLDLGDSFKEVDSSVERAKRGLEKVIEIRNATNGGLTPDSATLDALNNAYSQLNTSWIEAKEQPSLKMALSFPLDASNKTILIAINGRGKIRELTPPFEMASAA